MAWQLRVGVFSYGIGDERIQAERGMLWPLRGIVGSGRPGRALSSLSHGIELWTRD